MPPLNANELEDLAEFDSLTVNPSAHLELLLWQLEMWGVAPGSWTPVEILQVIVNLKDLKTFKQRWAAFWNYYTLPRIGMADNILRALSQRVTVDLVGLVQPLFQDIGTADVTSSTYNARCVVMRQGDGVQAYYRSSGGSFADTFFPIKDNIVDPITPKRPMPWLNALFRAYCIGSAMVVDADRADGLQLVLGTIKDMEIVSEGRSWALRVDFVECRPIAAKYMKLYQRKSGFFLPSTLLEFERTTVSLDRSQIQCCNPVAWLKFVSFLIQFGEWEELQQSACLGGVWATPVFEQLRLFVLAYTFKLGYFFPLHQSMAVMADQDNTRLRVDAAHGSYPIVLADILGQNAPVEQNCIR